MRFGQLAATAGVSRDTIRHYLEQGLISATRDPHNGYQEFSAAMAQRLAQTRGRIAELQTQCARMQDAIDQWDAMPDGKPNGSSICRLIESQQPGSQS